MTLDYIQKESTRLRERLLLEFNYNMEDINVIVDFILFGTMPTKEKDSK